MDEGQPENAPPEQWAIRTDAGARKVIDRIDRLRGELEVLKAELEHAVTHKQLIAGLGACIFSILAAAGVLLVRVEATSKAAGAAALQVATEARDSGARLEGFLKVELQDARREQREDIAGVKTDLRNATRALERSRRPAREP